MAARDGIALSARQRKLIGKALEGYGRKREVAARVGCTGQHLNGIVSGTKNPSAEVLKRLCKALGFHLDLGRVKIKTAGG